MKTIQLKLFQFHELTEEGKAKAIADNADFNVNFNWWDIVYEDARNIGLKITEFDLDRGHYCKAEFIEDASYTARQIMIQHGEQADTYGYATEFMKRHEHCEREQMQELDEAVDSIQNGFLYSLAKAYLRTLDSEYDHLTSDEAIADTLIANEYWFTADGKLATSLEKLALTT